MNEFAVSPTTKKRSFSKMIVPFLVMIGVIAFLYSATLVLLELFVKPLAEDAVYSFFVSQLLIALSGLLYGWILLLFQASTFQELSHQLRLKMKPLLSTMLLATVLTALGFLVVILPGVILVILFMFYPFVVVEEKKENWNALKRSGQLFKAIWWKLILSVFLFYLLFVFGAGLAMYAFAFHQLTAEIIVGSVLIPLEAFVYYRLYKKARSIIQQKVTSHAGGKMNAI